eukprot:c6303_g1_i1.p1 GENE.c6303_g1_i1~~c6303_g1_i1.p1  ORF type:complete len:347 (+),score=77.12 c6303_g1_i1:27-1067(+)
MVLFVVFVSAVLNAASHSTMDLVYQEVLNAYGVDLTDAHPIERHINATLQEESPLYRRMVEKVMELDASAAAIQTEKKAIVPVKEHSDIGSTLRERVASRSGHTGGLRMRLGSMEAHSLEMCTERLNRDIADTISDVMVDSARSGLVSLLIDGIVVIICMIAVAILFVILLGSADGESSEIRNNFILTVNPAIMSVVWPMMENDVTINLVDQATTAIMNAVTQKARYRLTVTIANYLSDVVSMHLYRYVLEEELPVLAAGVSHRVLHAVVLTLSRSLTRSLAHTIPRYVRGVLAKNTVRLFYCVYCYREGQFCTYCFAWNSFGDPQKTKSMEPDLTMIKTESYYDT